MSQTTENLATTAIPNHGTTSDASIQDCLSIVHEGSSEIMSEMSNCRQVLGRIGLLDAAFAVVQPDVDKFAMAISESRQAELPSCIDFKSRAAEGLFLDPPRTEKSQEEQDAHRISPVYLQCFQRAIGNFAMPPGNI